jgi:hypothetical protein
MTAAGATMTITVRYFVAQPGPELGVWVGIWQTVCTIQRVETMLAHP